VGLLVGCWCIDQARFPILSGLVGLLVGWFSLVGCSDPFSGFPGCWWAGGAGSDPSGLVGWWGIYGEAPPRRGSAVSTPKN